MHENKAIEKIKQGKVNWNFDCVDISEVTNTDIRNEVNEKPIQTQNTINECKVSNGIKNPFNADTRQSNSSEEETKSKVYNESLKCSDPYFQSKGECNNGGKTLNEQMKRANFSKSHKISQINYQSDNENGQEIKVDPNIQKVLKKNKTDKGPKEHKKPADDKYQSLAKCFMGDEEEDS